MTPRICAKQQLHKRRTQPVPERHERVLELPETDIPAAVHVETVEEAAPRGEEAPEAAELVEVDGAAAVRVEHADHHFDRVVVEGGVVAVDEGAAQFFFRELAGAVFVDLQEEGPEGVAVVAVSGCWGSACGWALVVGDWRAVVVALGWRALTVACRWRRRGDVVAEWWGLLLLLLLLLAVAALAAVS